jgi:phosphatidylserine decarboxylase
VVTAFAGLLIALWVLFVGFVLCFFRDPDPAPVADPKAIVAPAHGTVDVIDETTEAQVMAGPCQRLSIFLSVFDVHVQKAPVSGRITLLEHKPGKFLSATKAHSAEHNECVLIGIEPSDFPGQRFGLRLIAGLIARRILPWVAVGDTLARSERISLIQFGSRVDLYLPPAARVQAKLGDKVKGGETIVALMP